RPCMATVLPASVPSPATSRAACMAHTTPLAVHGDGLPDPPTSAGTQLTNRVVAKTLAMSLGRVPTPSAVMYAPLRDDTNDPYSRKRVLRKLSSRYGASGSRTMTPLPPPHHNPAKAFLRPIPCASRSPSLKN